ncbi:MAG: 50S ribosomal protein L35 [Phycisphaerae bacterium]|nr:50S ribosomal protein L35 [Phycisphaerae bacterium]
MPKMKTNKAVAKRVKVTARGRVLRRVAGSGHLKSRKSPKRLRNFRQKRELAKPYAKQARRMMGQ